MAEKHPAVVEHLRGYLAQAREDLGDGKDYPGKNCRPVGMAENPRTILPRPGVEGDAAYAPVLKSDI